MGFRLILRILELGLFWNAEDFSGAILLNFLIHLIFLFFLLVQLWLLDIYVLKSYNKMLLVSYSICFHVLLFRFLEFCLMILCNLVQIIELTHQIFVIYFFLLRIHFLYNFLWLHPYAQFRFSWRFHVEVLEKNLIEIRSIIFTVFDVSTIL